VTFERRVEPRTIQKMTTTTILPAGEPEKKPDFWEYFEKLPPTWGTPPDSHVLYIYRRTSEIGPCPQLERLTGPLTMPDRSQVVLTDREELEGALTKKYGGGVYRLILKHKGQRVAEGRIIAEGQPKNTPPGVWTDSVNGSIPPQPGAPPPVDVATQAMHLVANQPSESIDVAVRAVQAAGDMVQRMASGNGNGTQAPAGDTEEKQLFRTMMAAAIQRMMAPPPDPLETITKLLAVMQGLTQATNPAQATNPIVSRILERALDGVLNPQPSGPAVSTGAELVRTLPQLGSYVTEALTNWRLGVQAQRDTAAMMARQAPAMPMPNPTVLPAPRANVVPAAGSVPPAVIASPTTAPAPGRAPGPQPPISAPSLEWIESRLIEIFKRPVSAADAADSAIDFLDATAPDLLDRLRLVDEAHLLGIFQSRPVLREATANVPRLQEFIRAFLMYLREDEAATVPEPTVATDEGKKPN
jgi:hypothetical protein